MQSPRRALYTTLEWRRCACANAGTAELFSQSGQSLCQLVSNGRRRSQVLDRVAAFDNRTVGPIESLFEAFLCLAMRKHIVYRLKMEHQPLKALQQRVVQLPGDAGSFGQARFKS